MKNLSKKFYWVVLVAGVGLIPWRAVGGIRLQSGSLAFLKQESRVNVEYDYNGMKVSGMKEEDFVAKKVADYNKKQPGRGDQWRQAWINDRTEKYQPKFEQLLNKYASGKRGNLQFGSFKDAKYTLILKTTFTSEGYNVAIMARPAFINANAIFVETQNRTNVIAVVTITKAPGMDAWGNDFDAGSRIQEAYAKAGKELGIFIAKKIK